MLSHLRIENFAIIERLELDFSQQLVVFTGETGAGKSIIIDAVEALLGGRSDASMVRAGADFANIEATFNIPDTLRSEIIRILEREELLDDPDTLTLGRQIRSNGRSAARVNGRTVNISLLKELGEFLVDLHGQSEHLSLLRVNQHLGLLDSFANTSETLSAYTRLYQRLLGVRRELKELRSMESEAARRIDMLNYQINEIESARLKPGEEEALRSERNRLANAEGLASFTQAALQALDEGDPDSPSATDLLGEAGHALASLARLDPSQARLAEQIQQVIESAAELAHSLRDYLESIEFNPKRLDQVEERLNLIVTLKRKYAKPGSAGVEDILEFARQARQQLESIEHASERIAELEKEETALLEELGRVGERLSQERRRAAHTLEEALETELESLNMSGARFKVDFQRQPDPEGAPTADGSRVAFHANGLEQVEFLVAPNPGEGLKPLVKIASGGETSRLMLAIKNVLARADQVPTLIFDEIDQGIGGRVGSVVGHKLWQLARQHQVLCVTHLPQLAAFGELHLHVQKSLADGRTSTHVETLQGEQRILELAQMMGEISAGTKRSAEELLENVARLTQRINSSSGLP